MPEGIGLKAAPSQFTPLQTHLGREGTAKPGSGLVLRKGNGRERAICQIPIFQLDRKGFAGCRNVPAILLIHWHERRNMELLGMLMLADGVLCLRITIS